VPNRAILFPGQGMQRPGMGALVFDAYPECLANAEAIVGFSIRDFFLDASSEQFNDTRYLQPALYTVNAMSYRRYIDEGGALPKYLAGHSLGELNALQASGVFDFQTGLRLVQARAQCMSECTGGGMAAVLGLTADEVAEVIAEDGLGELSIANYNSDLQVVISGPIPRIREAEETFYQKDALKYVVLRVNGAFHTKALDAAATKFGRYLQAVAFLPPSIPVISNTWGVPYVTSSIARTLAEHIVRPVRWSESVSYMRDGGVDDFIEMGESTKLLDMVKNIAHFAAAGRL
jgi:malonyl CoA-acyl carrier protein transacylase